MGDDKKRKKDEVKQKIDEFSRKKRRREHCIKRERERKKLFGLATYPIFFYEGTFKLITKKILRSDR